MTRTLAAIAAVLIGAAPAAAVEITNQDDSERTVEIVAGGQKTTATLAPGESRSDLCGGGCDITLGLTTLEGLAGDESVVIKNGEVDFAG